MRSDGKKRPSRALSLFHRAVFWLGGRCIRTVEIEEDGERFLFRCPNMQTIRRATTLFVKEQGTIEWLKSTLKPGDVFLDIGANIGLYSIYGGNLVGANGHVYAVEPHMFNATGLMENIQVNGLSDRVDVLTLALSADDGYDNFHYTSWQTGTALNQFGDAAAQSATATEFVGKELKFATTIDRLLAAGAIAPPNVVKIDVDGLEPDILTGMTGLLTGPDRPRSLQVEVAGNQSDDIDRQMAAMGYHLDHRHFTQAGKKRLKRGEAEAAIAHNAVFVPAT